MLSVEIAHLKGIDLIEQLIKGEHQNPQEACESLCAWRGMIAVITQIGAPSEITSKNGELINGVTEKYIKGVVNEGICQTEFFKTLVTHENQNKDHIQKIKDVAHNHCRQLFAQEKKEYPTVTEFLVNYYMATIPPDHAMSTLTMYDEVRRPHREYFLDTAKRATDQFKLNLLTSETIKKFKENFDLKNFSEPAKDEVYPSYIAISKKAMKQVSKGLNSSQVKKAYKSAMQKYLTLYMEESVLKKPLVNEEKQFAKEEIAESQKPKESANKKKLQNRIVGFLKNKAVKPSKKDLEFHYEEFFPEVDKKGSQSPYEEFFSEAEIH